MVATEIAELVAAGLSATEAVGAATWDARRWLGRPGLEEGAPADLVLCDLNAPIVVDLDKLKSKSRNSPFDGRRLFGEVRMTLVDGRVVHQA